MFCVQSPVFHMYGENPTEMLLTTQERVARQPDVIALHWCVRS